MQRTQLWSDAGAVGASNAVCENCGAALGPDDLFCTSCGFAVGARFSSEVAMGATEQSPALERLCLGCGEPLVPGNRFCTVCGRPVPVEYIMEEEKSDALVDPVPQLEPPTPEPQPNNQNDDVPVGYCIYCGGPLSSDDAFCTRCGKPVEPNEKNGLPLDEHPADEHEATPVDTLDVPPFVDIARQSEDAESSWEQTESTTTYEDDDDPTVRSQLLIITPDEARDGCRKMLRLKDGTEIQVDVPAGANPGTKVDIAGMGLEDAYTGHRGPLRVSFYITR